MILSKNDKLNIPYKVKAEINNNYRELDMSARTVDLIANTYYYFDSDYDVLFKGCAVKSIQERGAQSQLPGKIKHLSNHDLNKSVGRCLLIEETKYNGDDVLRASSYMSECDDGQNTLKKYKEGLIDQHSIGFKYIQLEYVEKDTSKWESILKILINPEDAIKVGYLYAVKEIKLYEYSSLDGFGANRLTPYLGSKSSNKVLQYNNLCEKLDSLHAAMKSGVRDKYTLELEELQIKQMIFELFDQEPLLKDTIKPFKKSTNEINYEYLAQNFKLK